MNLFKKFLEKKDKYRMLFKKYRKKPRFVRKTINFENNKFTMPDAVSFAYQIKEIFQEEIYKFETKTDKPLIYDCGANIGTSVIYFKKLFPESKIKAFEADENIFKILSENIKHLDGVELFHNAVWINNEELFFNSEGTDGGSLINNFTNKQKVKAIRLKELLEKEEKIEFLKMDIEGAETDVIIDCCEELKKVENLFVEYHSMANAPQNLDKILSVLKNFGFRYYIQNISYQEHPFIVTKIWNNMDLQVNIFAVKEKINGCPPVNTIPIFLASDDNYSPFVATALTSIVKNTKSFIKFYILDGGIKPANRKKIESLKNKFHNFSIEFISMKDYELARFPNLHHYSLNTFSRYFISELKHDLDKILYLDADIIVKGDIAELYNQDLGNYPIGAVLEDFYPENYTYLEDTFPQYKGGANYFNAGVLIISLDYFRKNNMTRRFVDRTIELKDKLSCPDQDIFNLFFENNFKILDYKFNLMPDHKDYIMQLGKKEAMAALDNPCIIHYTGKKPWKNILAERVADFWDIAKLTPFYQELKNQFNSRYKTDLITLRKKIFKYKVLTKIFADEKREKFLQKLFEAKMNLKNLKKSESIKKMLAV